LQIVAARKRQPIVLGWGTSVHGLIGNCKMTATILPNGTLNHLFWPSVGFSQHIKEAFAGILCLNEASRFTWLKDSSWIKSQEYISNANMLKTTYINGEVGLKVTGLDFVFPTEDVLARYFIIKNLNSTPTPVRFLHFQNPILGEVNYGNVAEYDKAYDAIVHYYRGYYMAVGSDTRSHSYQCGICKSESDSLIDALDGELSNVDLAIFMGDRGVNSALSYNLGEIGSGLERSIRIFIAMGSNYQQVASLLEWAKTTSSGELYDRTLRYWREYASQLSNLRLDEKRKLLYERSILTVKLLCDKIYGGIIASPSLDPDYRYVWPRDATYMAFALDKAGYHREAENFYDWCRKAQDSEGRFRQRYFVNPRFVGPCWGEELDQTGIVLWGCKAHYRATKDKGFVVRSWPMIRSAAEYLCLFQDRKTGEIEPTLDLWEERYSKHIYSFAAVYAGLKSASELAEELQQPAFAKKWAYNAALLKDFISSNFWSEEKKTFIRSIEPYDEEVDVTALSLCIPFEIYPPDDPRMIATAEQISLAFKYAVGGIGRYPSDRNYGGNPWIISTLWLAIYYAERGEIENSEKLINWCLDHATNLGLLPEQIHKDTGEPLSATPLGWSHAMYILASLAIEQHA
jgi:oligosaccharide amylase